MWQSNNSSLIDGSELQWHFGPFSFTTGAIHLHEFKADEFGIGTIDVLLMNLDWKKIGILTNSLHNYSPSI